MMQSSFAGVVLNGTRVIFSQGEKEKTIYFQNNGNTPSLVQLWTDRSHPNSKIDDENQPFFITPQIFRMNVSTGQSVRLIFLDAQKVPQDRESLFFLNFTEIPMIKENKSEANKLVFIFKNRLKVFYRPEHLKESSGQSVDQLIFKIKRESKKVSLYIKNPSPYYVNINDMFIGHQAQLFKVNEESGLIAPFSEVIWSIDENPDDIQLSTVKFSMMNDYGAVVNHEVVLTQ